MVEFPASYVSLQECKPYLQFMSLHGPPFSTAWRFEEKKVAALLRLTRAKGDGRGTQEVPSCTHSQPPFGWKQKSRRK